MGRGPSIVLTDETTPDEGEATAEGTVPEGGTPAEGAVPEGAEGATVLSMTPEGVPAALAASNTIAEDFEGADVGTWGMTGDLAGSLSIKTDASGNKYLYLNGTKLSTKSAVKSLGEDIPRLATATVSFDWYIGNLTTDSRGGYTGIQLKSDGTEVFSLYHKDTRAAGAENPALAYSAEGFDKKKDSDFKVDNIIADTTKSSYAVEIAFGFSAPHGDIDD